MKPHTAPAKQRRSCLQCPPDLRMQQVTEGWLPGCRLLLITAVIRQRAGAPEGSETSSTPHSSGSPF
ncbi:hypothetical protein AAFF_G00346660 [Aldrovandia affinis]|uniref:Uncharacterized protein n=1 Tax=Aldrovandia affinis TaxID=143900 RepID=A0AAD7WP30_9TELE|nr:hypothetical protein AAFF_G00346660 [Aldrovandia affinis]